ncbi:Predicted chitinase [Pseudomonas sp. 8AS]|uniref:glycoside hydrolase family 19 protein n=1 Tax=Pseudomonas sp. 8AS TaxID=2653163 RepID=UPI0012F3E607|nr:glycoside hydrolase family 19 protein [Pseudomonas sp. 8AS]VXB03384.1 Predicted chitinase [Pseudomonas sp. 8AS]
MHLLDLTGYEANPTLQRPAFWGAGLCKVKSDAPDKVRGLNVREHYKVVESNEHYAQYQNKLTTLPRGTRIETGEAAASPNHNWRRLIRATPAVEGLAENTGWVYVLEAKELAENQYLVSEDKSTDIPAIEQIGLHVRESANASSNVLAVLPHGTEIQVSGEGNYVKLEAIVSGNAIPPLTAGADGKLPGYVWLQSLEAQRSPNDLAKDNVYPLPVAQKIKAGELIGHMGLYQEHDQEGPTSRLHLEVFSCEDVPAFIEKSKQRAESLPNDQKTLIMVGKRSTIIQPTSADTQISANYDVRTSTDTPTEGCWVKVQPYAVLKINKSDLGAYSSKQYALDANQKSALATTHGIDVSEMPDKVDFLMETYLADGTDPQPYTSGAIPTSRPMRKIGVKLDTPVWVKRSMLDAQGQRSSTSGVLEAWKNFPLSQRIDGVACGFDRILSKASWSDLGVDHKAIDADTTRWWYVRVANAADQDVSGWICEKDLIVTQHSPWGWPGFSYLKDATTLVSQHAQALNTQGELSTEEVQTYAAKIDEAEHGPIFQSLFEIIDQPNNEGIRDKELTPLEIKNALDKPWLAQQLSLLITNYESEWFWKEEKWDELDKLMGHTPADQNLDWVREKERIQKLSWWSDIAGTHGVSTHGLTWHIHPIGMLANYASKQELINIDKFIETYTPLHPTFNNTANLGITSKENLKEFLKNINKYYSEHDEKPNRYELAYMLATARHEMYHFPTGEYFSKKPEVGDYHYFDKYDPVLADTPQKRQNAIDHENTVEGDGFKYRGRGPVHLTWKVNYRRAMEKFGPDFVNNPDLAAEFENSVPIMIWGMKAGIFTGKSIGEYIKSTTVDYEGARRVINGVDEKVLIASYAKKFEEILKNSSSAPTEF